jgi:hypothetical protein
MLLVDEAAKKVLLEPERSVLQGLWLCERLGRCFTAACGGISE